MQADDPQLVLVLVLLWEPAASRFAWNMLKWSNGPPMIATTPRLTSGVAKTASSLAITMSQFKTISVPPPYAPPLTAAIIGLHEDCLREIAPKPFTCCSTSFTSLSGVFAECARRFHLRRIELAAAVS